MTAGEQRRVAVTAGAAGIGLAIAAGFVADGDRVEVCDIDDAALESLRTRLPGAQATRVDLRDGHSLDAWMDGALGRLGGLDVLVNNAGTAGPTAPVEDVEPAQWRECLAVCLDSHYRCARRAAPVFKRQGSGVMINISSTAGLVGYGLRTPYAAAKWAVIGLTKSLAIELGPYGVRCNCICPGAVRGDRMQRVIEAEARGRGLDPSDVAREYVSGQSIQRFVEPQEVAGLCRFLASPAAAMISGQAIGLDGHTETYHLT